MREHAIIEETFSVWSVPGLYKEVKLSLADSPESRDRSVGCAGSDTTTVALRVVEGDENGTQCLGYNWVTLPLLSEFMLHAITASVQFAAKVNRLTVNRQS
jgi:hypothetical protein